MEPDRSFAVAAEAFLSQPTNIVRAGLVLSLCVTITRDELQNLVGELWPNSYLTDADLDALYDWPFVLSGESGWSMLQPLSRILSANFQQTFSELFRDAHARLSDMEARRVADDDREDWFIRGRTAYYLAGVDPVASANKFGEVFDIAPALDRTSCRIWLATLVDRQSELLGATSRTVSFFRGFRYYVAGARQMAVTEFDYVLASDELDTYRAISLHLRAISQGDQAKPSVIDMLTESVELSHRLGLGMNEVMARHSLTWALLRQGLKGNTGDQVLALAKINIEQSRALGDKGMLAWCLRAYTVLTWLSYVGEGRNQVSEEARAKAPDLLGDLSEVIALADSVEDLETVLVTMNDRASIYCDLSQLDEALVELQTASDRAPDLGFGARIIRQLAQTSGRAASIARTVRDRRLDSQFKQLADEFDRTFKRFSRKR